jgi:hypothetical protein
MEAENVKIMTCLQISYLFVRNWHTLDSNVSKETRRIQPSDSLWIWAFNGWTLRACNAYKKIRNKHGLFWPLHLTNRRFPTKHWRASNRRFCPCSISQNRVCNLHPILAGKRAVSFFGSTAMLNRTRSFSLPRQLDNVKRGLVSGAIYSMFSESSAEPQDPQ